MHDPFLHIGRIGMGGCMAGFEASALVDGHVDHHRPGRIAATIWRVTTSGRRGAHDQYRADHQVGLGAATGDRVQSSPFDVLQAPAEAFGQAFAALRDWNPAPSLRAPKPTAVSMALSPTDAAADHGYLRRTHAGHAAQQHAAPAMGLFESIGARLDGHPAGDLRHRGEQRQTAVLVGDRLIGDADGAALSASPSSARGRGPDADR